MGYFTSSSIHEIRVCDYLNLLEICIKDGEVF